jgi:arylsulfatase A-like enzyme
MDSHSNKPNIVLIMIESWDGRVVGNYGDPAMKNITPNLNKFAEKGVQFKYNYTSHPICCPARSNLWSGQYTHHCKSWNNYKGLEKGTKILRNVLEDHGDYVFATKDPKKIGIGKHDYWSGNHTNQARITAWTGMANIYRPSYTMKKPLISNKNTKKSHKVDWIRASSAKKFLKKQKKRQNKGDKNPFFLYLSLTTPHPTFHTSKYWMEKVDYEKVSIPLKEDEKEVHPVIKYQKIQKAWEWGFDPDSVRKTRAIYYAMVAETDAIIGGVLDSIEELGFNENTYVIITADHGENNMEHDLYYKMNMYESSVNTPLFIRGPDVQKGILSKNITSLIDLYPTILDIANIPKENAPNTLDGESLLPYIRGDTKDTRNWAFSIHTGTANNTSVYMIREGTWKYVKYYGYEPQLFNMETDPDEIKNLASENQKIIKELDEKLHSVCDCDAVHQEWQTYCKQSFKEYREKVSKKPIPLFEYGAAKLRATYQEVMANTYKGWTKDDEQKLEDWLNDN